MDVEVAWTAAILLLIDNVVFTRAQHGKRNFPSAGNAILADEILRKIVAITAGTTWISKSVSRMDRRRLTPTAGFNVLGLRWCPRHRWIAQNLRQFLQTCALTILSLQAW